MKAARLFGEMLITLALVAMVVYSCFYGEGQ